MTLPLEEELNHIIRAEDFLAGGAVVVVQDNRITYAKGFGKAHLGHGERPLTPDTIVSIMSIAKSFTALSLLKLVEEEKLHLDAPVAGYLPHFQTTAPSDSAVITVRQLLSHTAGFAGDLGIGNSLCLNAFEYRALDDVKEQFGITEEILQGIHSRSDVTKYLEHVTLANPPGTEWNYCTDAYIIAADLFEQVSGQSWDTYMEETLFPALKLDRTTLLASNVLSDDDHASYYTSNESALRHSILPVPSRKDIYASPFPVNPLAAPMGFLYSTARDLGTYMCSYMSERPFLSPAMKELMLMPVWHWDEETGYALGWGIQQKENHRIVEHGGGSLGVSAYMCIVPEENIGVIVVSNHDQTPTQNICYQVLDLLLQS